MRRVLRCLAVVAMLLATATMAHADCSQEIATLRSRIATLNDPVKQHELELLLAKADDDNAAGRANLCVDDLQHAQQLVK